MTALVRAFSTANPLYRRATVNFYKVDAQGNLTTELITLWLDEAGQIVAKNPQVLDGQGKLSRPVYFDAAHWVKVEGLADADHTTGVFRPSDAPDARLSFLTASQANAINVGSVAGIGVSTGSSWDGPYTHTLSGTPKQDQLFIFENHSGHPQTIQNDGVNDPLDAFWSGRAIPNTQAWIFGSRATDGKLALIAWGIRREDGTLPISMVSGLQTALDGKQADLDVVPQAEAEAGTATTERIWTAERVAQAIAALQVTDHGALSGLSDDDHPQYTLADGSRPFTAPVGGVSPTQESHLATRGYVENLVEGLIWQQPVLDKDLTDPPGTPNAGDRYIVASGGTGAWSGHDDEIAEWDGVSAWDFHVPSEGWTTWVIDEDVKYQFDGLAWVAIGSGGVSDHGALSGLLDDDHTQYHTDGRADTWAAGKSFRTILIDVIANRPAAGVAGRFFLSTDESVRKLYRDTGATWELAAAGGALAAKSTVATADIDDLAVTPAKASFLGRGRGLGAAAQTVTMLLAGHRLKSTAGAVDTWNHATRFAPLRQLVDSLTGAATVTRNTDGSITTFANETAGTKALMRTSGAHLSKDQVRVSARVLLAQVNGAWHTSHALYRTLEGSVGFILYRDRLTYLDTVAGIQTIPFGQNIPLDEVVDVAFGFDRSIQEFRLLVEPETSASFEVAATGFAEPAEWVEQQQTEDLGEINIRNGSIRHWGWKVDLLPGGTPFTIADLRLAIDEIRRLAPASPGRDELLEHELQYAENQMTAVTVDDEFDGRWEALTADAAITLTLDAQASVGTRCAFQPAGDGAVSVAVEAGAGYWLENDATDGTIRTTSFGLLGYGEFEVIANSGGNAAEWRFFGDSDHTQIQAAPVVFTKGAQVPDGSVSGALTMADHAGGAFKTGGNVTIPNEAGFTVSLKAGGAHDVDAGGAALSLASGDWLSVVVWATDEVEYVHQLAADVGTLATS